MTGSREEGMAYFDPADKTQSVSLPVRRKGHKALRVKDGKMETFDPNPPEGKTPDTPESLARWVWCQFVGIPITEPYDAMYLQLLERIQFMHRVQFTLGLRECMRQFKEAEENRAKAAEVAPEDSGTPAAPISSKTEKG